MTIIIEGNLGDWYPVCFTAVGMIVLAIGVLLKKAWLCNVAVGLCQLG